MYTTFPHFEMVWAMPAFPDSLVVGDYDGFGYILEGAESGFDSLPLFARREKPSLCADINVCSEVNGHDDDDGRTPADTLYVNGISVSKHGDKSYISGLPISHDMQVYCTRLVEHTLDSETIDLIHSGINAAEDMGLDADLIRGTDPTLRL